MKIYETMDPMLENYWTPCLKRLLASQTDSISKTRGLIGQSCFPEKMDLFFVTGDLFKQILG